MGIVRHTGAYGGIWGHMGAYGDIWGIGVQGVVEMTCVKTNFTCMYTLSYRTKVQSFFSSWDATV